MAEQHRVRLLRARAQALACGEREEGVEAVVRRVFAVQAQDATAADLAVRVRARDLTLAQVVAAYERERSVVRGWYLRGTLHTVTAEDARWVRPLLAPRVLAGTARRYRELGLDETVRERADALLRRVLGTHGPLTRAELTGHLAGLGVATEGQAPFHLIRHAALTGVLCHGPRRGGEATYVLLDDWLPAGRPRWEGEAAVAELARRYLAGYGPAAPEDFATWSGVPLGWARKAWSALTAARTIATEGSLSALAGAPATAEPTGDVRMVPAYDTYLLGYRTRETAVLSGHEREVWPGGGVIRPTVLVDGLAVATWSRAQGPQPVRVAPFAPLTPEVEAAVRRECVAVTRFLAPPDEVGSS